jgi:serine/threonine protein kinase
MTKLIDFGAAKLMKEQPSLEYDQTPTGTCIFMAPEV